MIPAVPAIQDSLAVLSLEEIAQDSPRDSGLVICESIGRVFADRTRIKDDTAIVLKQRAGAPVALSSLVVRVADELHHVGHPYVAPKAELRPLLSAKVIAMATALGCSRSNPLDVLNAVIAAISPVRVSQWAVLINPATGLEQYRFGDFAYGAVDIDTLRYRCEKAGSDFADLYGGELRGRRSVFRETRDVKTIDINAIRPPHPPDTSSVNFMPRISDDYFANLADAEQVRFMADLDGQQAIYGAVGLGTIPAQSLRQMSALTQWITVFDRQARTHGWVVPNQTFFQLWSTEPKALSTGHVAIRSALKLDDWEQKPLDPLIQTFCQYFTTAQDHERQGDVEGALLHLVFALDLLLGGSAGDALTAVLADRVAIVAHLPLRKNLSDVVKFVKECYDMRSDYVHRGKKGTLTGLVDRLEELLRVAR